MMKLMLWIIMLSMALSVCLSATVTTPPSDISAIHGSTITIRCNVEGDKENDMIILQWIKKASQQQDDDEIIYINVDSNMQPIADTLNPIKYHIIGRYDLVISNVNFEDAGIYQCKLILTMKTFSANVVVLNTPQISVNEDLQVGHSSNVTCHAEYSAPPSEFLDLRHSPKMRIYINDVTPIVLAEEFVVLTTAYNTNIYIIQHTFQYAAKVDDDGKEIVCEVLTEEPEASLSTNMQILLNYGVHSVEIYPTKHMYEVGEIVSCSAAGHPKPDYAWHAISSPDEHTVTGKQLPIITSMAGHNIWVCVVSNTIRGVTYSQEKNITFFVDRPTMPAVIESVTESQNENNAYGGTVEVKTGSSAMIAVYVLVPVTAIIIVIIIVIVCTRSKRKNGHVYSPRKKDAEAAHAHEKEQLQNEPIKTPIHQNGQNGQNGKNGTDTPKLNNGGTKPCITVSYKHQHTLQS